MFKKVLMLCCLIMSKSVLAYDFGLVGSVFEVKEQSLLSLIKTRLSSLNSKGALHAMEASFQKTANMHAIRPNPVNLARAQKTREHQYKPEVLLTNSIYDYKGHILYPAGTKVNALEKLPAYKPCYIFFDGDDKAQNLFVKKVMSRCLNPKLILTKGSVLDAEKGFKTAIYFDQAGKISQKLKINAVPTVVIRRNNTLLVTSYAIKENGDAL